MPAGNASACEPIDGIKVATKNGWFVARPSGIESLHRLHAESVASPAHLQRILVDAQGLGAAVIAPVAEVVA